MHRRQNISASARRSLRFESLENRRVLAAVSIANLTGEPGSNLQVPINIDDASGVRAAEIRLSYNTQLLDLDPSSVAAGVVWSGNGDTQVVANVDDAAGTVVIFISSANPLGNAAGSLAILDFSIAAAATGGTIAALDLTRVILNEGAVNVTPTPQPGVDSTDGQIAINGDFSFGPDRIGGFVFADADASGTLGIGEAIPDVTIRLVDVASGATRQTTTADDGSYQFANLAAGSYRLEQVQPIAYIDQSPNTLTVQLVANTPLLNQNFVERGLRAGHHYTRLLTNSVQPLDSVSWRSLIRKINADAAQGSATSPQLPTAATASSVAGGQSLVASAFQASAANPATSASSLTPPPVTSSSAAEGEASPAANSAMFGFADIERESQRQRARWATIDGWLAAEFAD